MASLLLLLLRLLRLPQQGDHTNMYSSNLGALLLQTYPTLLLFPAGDKAAVEINIEQNPDVQVSCKLSLIVQMLCPLRLWL